MDGTVSSTRSEPFRQLGCVGDVAVDVVLGYFSVKYAERSSCRDQLSLEAGNLDAEGGAMA